MKSGGELERGAAGAGGGVDDEHALGEPGAAERDCDVGAELVLGPAVGIVRDGVEGGELAGGGVGAGALDHRATCSSSARTAATTWNIPASSWRTTCQPLRSRSSR